jgi:5-methylcytosine-specific restriction enzyme subunit McrC
VSTTLAKPIPLIERKSTRLPKDAIPDKVGEALWRDHGKRIAVEFPSPKTDNQWDLTPQGWVGYVAVSEDFVFWLKPKVEIQNLFRMLEYAYRLKSFHFLDGAIESSSLEEFYERLANVLAKRILDRARRGLYRSYVPESSDLPYVRGQLDVRRTIQAPWDVRVHCHYQLHTPDVEENQILAWTLLRITRSDITLERSLPAVRRAYRTLQGTVDLKQFRPHDCVDRLYNRLNEDYEPLHALCRFFLENTGPSHDVGDRKMLPFLVNMDRLYELFVAEWLRVHLPSQWSIEPKERVYIGADQNWYFEVDLVLYRADTLEPVCVLDTKYKADKPHIEDIAQVVAYAESKACSHAVLIYPAPIEQSLNEKVGDVRVRSLSFGLDGDLEAGGHKFVAELISCLPLEQEGSALEGET